LCGFNLNGDGVLGAKPLGEGVAENGGSQSVSPVGAWGKMEHPRLLLPCVGDELAIRGESPSHEQ